MDNVIDVKVRTAYDDSGMKRAKEDTKEYGDKLESTGEQAGAAETRLIGIHDVIDGTATVMKGPGEQGMVSYIQGWADIAGGVEGVLPLLKALSLNAIKTGATQVATAAKTVGAWLAMKATAVASAAQMAAAWLISLGPIALVIAAFIAVGGALAVLWAKSQTFRNIVTGALGGVRDAAGAVWGAIKEVWGWFSKLVGFVGAIVGAIAKIGAAFTKVITPIKSAVGWIERFIADSLITGDAKFNFSSRSLGATGSPGGASGNRARAGFAHGGITPGGRIRVGEAGAEVLDLPAGARVRTNADSSAVVGGGQVHVTVELVGGDTKLLRALRDSMQVQVRNQAGGSVQRWLGLGTA